MASFYPAASGDDGWVNPSGAINTTDTYLQFGSPVGIGLDSFIRFTNITIPNAETINSATINITASSDHTTTTCSVIIYGNDVDSAIAPTTTTEYNSLVQTAASVSWTVPAFTSGSGYTTPDVTGIIQEIVNRPGWSSGNDIMLMIVDSGSTFNAFRLVESYDNGTAFAELAINYGIAAPTISNISSIHGVSSLTF